LTETYGVLEGACESGVCTLLGCEELEPLWDEELS
jgi:hypothetical protein